MFAAGYTFQVRLGSMDHHVAAEDRAQLGAVDVGHSHPGQLFLREKWIKMVVFDTNNRDIMGIHGDIRSFVGHLEFHTTNLDDISRRSCMDVYHFPPVN